MFGVGGWAIPTEIRVMDDSAAPTEALLRRAAERLTGHQKRLFQAEVAVALCGGSARAAERRFGWGREAVHTGLNELRSGIRCVEHFVAKGRVPVEHLRLQLATDIRDLVEVRTHADPELKSDRRYTDLAAREVLDRLRADKGYAEGDLPSERTVRDILNRMGYRRTRIRKGKPVKKVAETDAIFANVWAVREQAKADSTTLELSVDTKAKVAEGGYARGGKNANGGGRDGDDGVGPRPAGDAEVDAARPAGRGHGGVHPAVRGEGDE